MWSGSRYSKGTVKPDVVAVQSSQDSMVAVQLFSVTSRYCRVPLRQGVVAYNRVVVL